MPSIELRSVQFGYARNTLFRDVSFAFESPCVISILGRSGSGKSSLLKLIAGVLSPNAGEISASTTKIAWVPQDCGLFPWLTVAENIVFPLSLARHATPRSADSRKIAQQLTIDLGISNILASYPKDVSGGQLQRAAIARSLAAGSDMMILDEPFSSLDGPTRTDLRRLLRRLTYDRNQITFLATHDLLDSAFISDRALVVRGGWPREILEVKLSSNDGTAERDASLAGRLASSLTEQI